VFFKAYSFSNGWIFFILKIVIYIFVRGGISLESNVFHSDLSKLISDTSGTGPLDASLSLDVPLPDSLPEKHDSLEYLYSHFVSMILIPTTLSTSQPSTFWDRLMLARRQDPSYLFLNHLTSEKDKEKQVITNNGILIKRLTKQV
jgi:hypothetical protein